MCRKVGISCLKYSDYLRLLAVGLNFGVVVSRYVWGSLCLLSVVWSYYLTVVFVFRCWSLLYFCILALLCLGSGFTCSALLVCYVIVEIYSKLYYRYRILRLSLCMLDLNCSCMHCVFMIRVPYVFYWSLKLCSYVYLP